LKSLKAQTNQWFTLLLKCKEETIPFIKKETEGLFPDNIQITGVLEYEQKIKDLIKGYEYLYLARVDSDDLWINNFIDLLHNYTPKPETELLLNQYCYNYDIKQDRLISFFHPSPQSYVLLYKVKEYLEGKRHKLPGGHWAAQTKIHEAIAGYNYMDTVHGTNTSSTFGSFKNQRKEIEGDEKDRVLAEFGVKKENMQ